MTRRPYAVLLAVAMTSCGSSDPLPPSDGFRSLTGPYTLEINPASGCGLPFAAYRFLGDATLDGAGSTVSLVDAPSGSRLTIVPGAGEAFTGSVEIGETLVGANRLSLAVTGKIEGRIVLAGRPEVRDARLDGTVRGSDASGSTSCPAGDHKWSLIQR